MQKRIILLGPQGSGKGTQADMLSKNYGFLYISTGNMFRQEIDRKTELGKRAQHYIQEGKLVPDDITIQMVQRHLQRDEAEQRGFILDGFPRNLYQARALERITEITDALFIDISDDEAVKRISRRRVCVCGMTYHIDYRPPKEEGKCDVCGRELLVRDDDKPDIVKARLRIYHRETEPLLDYYRARGLLRHINGEQSIPEVYADVVKALKM